MYNFSVNKLLILVFLSALVLFNNTYADEVVLDTRVASLECKLIKDTKSECKYRYGSNLDVKELRLKINEKEVQISKEGNSKYPDKAQTTAILFLVDVSDPNRKNTVERKNVQTLSEFLKFSKPHHKIGIAEFDSDLKILAPIGTDLNSLNKSLSEIKATGQATEFYKSILAGIDVLGKFKADRKALIVLSDGKDEDKAYKLEDVLKNAKSNNISIMGLGYLEKPLDSPYLQNLKRMSDETYGPYFDLTNVSLASQLIGKPFDFVEKGGAISFDLPRTFDKQAITLMLGGINGKVTELKAELQIPDSRNFQEKAIDFCTENWIYILIGSVIIISLLILLFIYLKKRAARNKPILYASLNELHGVGTKHDLYKTAIRLGRSADNDVQLLNDSISMHHAEIHRRREGGFYVVDLSSTNGVYVNNAKVNQGELKDDDILELGEVRLRFSIY